MATSNGGGFGNNLTSVLVALIGAVSAIGGAWIMTNNQSASQTTPAAQVSNVTEQNMGLPQISASSAPIPSAASVVAQPSAPASQPSVAPAASVAAQAPSTIVDATGGADAPAPLAGSTTIDYEQPWPNQQGLSQLVVERIEVARERVRVHLRFDNTASSPVTFYTATSASSAAEGIQTYIGDKKGPAHDVAETGGALFADPRTVEIPGGTRLHGWLEYSYATSKGKKDSLSLYFTSQTQGYPGAGTHRIQYEPLPIPAAK